MAASFALAIGTFDLTESFSNAISCLEHMQFGDGFDGAIQHALLQRGVLKLRLSRWGHAVVRLTQAEDPIIQTVNGFLVKLYLGNIEQLFAQGKLASSSTQSSPNGGVPAADWVVNTLHRLSITHNGLISRSHKQTPNFQPCILTIDSKSQWESLTMSLATLLDHLETVELEQPLDQLRSDDEYQITRDPRANEMDVHLLKVNAIGMDIKFAELLKFGGHQFLGTKASENADLHQGDVFAKDYKGKAIGASHSFRNTTVTGKAKVTQGNKYGT
jgi:hypothetical protein